MRLNRTQVKSVLRRLVESPEFVNLVLEKAGDGNNSSGGRVEPRITRKLARTVVDSGGKLNWFLDKVAKTPSKVNPESLALMQEEFPDDEDDQEYDPGKDMEAMKITSDDEDSIATASETGTPGRSSSAAVTPTSTSSQSLLKQDVSKKPEGDSTFKLPEAKSVIRSLNFEETESSTSDPQPSRNTRSKVSLNSVTLEELETQFEPPDVTPDMYDELPVDDDYTLFLAETFGYPVVKKPEEKEEEVTDPDFEYKDDEELLESIDEFKNNRSTKIPQKEVDALMQELFDAYELDKVADKAAKSLEKPKSIHNSLATAQAYANSSGMGTGLSDAQRALLGQQMRQHTQLLTQMALLTAKDPQLDVEHQNARDMLGELVQHSFKVPYSMFAQDNLFPSLKVIDQWKELPYPSSLEQPGPGRKPVCEVSTYLMEFMHDKPVFMYPHLLPISGMIPSESRSMGSKIFWSTGEDQLLALSLEEAQKSKRPEGFLGVFKRLLEDRKIYNRTVIQMRARYKNMTKTHLMASGDVQNPIRYFKKHKRAMVLPNSQYIPYLPGQVVAPKFAPVSSLPSAWRDGLKSFRPDPEEVSPERGEAAQKEIPQPPLTIIPTTSVITVALPLNSMPSLNSPLKATPIITVQDPPPVIAPAPDPLPTQSSQMATAMAKFRPIQMKPSSSSELPPVLPPQVERLKQPNILKKKSQKKKKDKSEGVDKIPAGIVPLDAPQPVPQFVLQLAVPTATVSSEKPKCLEEVAIAATKELQPNILNAAMEECGIEPEDVEMDSSPARPDEREKSSPVEAVGQEFPKKNKSPVNTTKPAATSSSSSYHLADAGEECLKKNNKGNDEKTSLNPMDEEEAKESMKKKTKSPIEDIKSPTRDESCSNRKTKPQRDAEVVLNTLQPEAISEETVRKEHEAMEIILLAKEVLDQSTLLKFFEIIVQLDHDPIKSFELLHPLCRGHPNLQELLLDLLTPDQAMALGPQVYSQHCQRNDLKKLVQKIKSAFPNQPGVQTRILKDFLTLLSKPDVTVEDLRSFGHKTFKSNPLLCDDFMSLLPEADMPDGALNSAPEHDKMDEDRADGSERINLPASEDEKQYGGEKCPCTCHTHPGSPHCIHCSIRVGVFKPLCN